ncbi:hypothetical protein [Polymorphospora lycopeni]|uniref:Uncharacterized protein n=1 Tax=Polymorphospora lycopeni TaxID=3140240 RepID=A0ABV5CSH5_9ACTN
MTMPTVRAIDASEQVFDDPSEVALHDLLADMNLRQRFVIVERLDREPAGHHYMQVYLNDDLSYQVEYREGGADRHFQAQVPRRPDVIGVESVARILADWASDRPGWRDALPWVPWPSAAPGPQA